MNFYVSVITDTIEYIESSISRKLTLADLSERVRISDFHFNRIFKTVTGITLKQYILGRKLTMAAVQLRATRRPVIDIALDFGFEYPEVFSRAFKNQLGISPAAYRGQSAPISVTPKASVVERDIINYRGTLALKGNIRLLDTLLIRGVDIDVNEHSNEFKQKLKAITEAFIAKSSQLACFHQDQFFTAVTCSGKDDGGYRVFCGRQPKLDSDTPEYNALKIPGGWYADFLYRGNMFDIREVFIDDLYKWIMVKEARLCANGIGMLNIYPGNYPSDPHVHILVPIEQPV